MDSLSAASDMADQLAARRAEARAILATNDRGGYTVPTAGLYPFQWNWDSAFCAIGFQTFDEPRAFAELESLFRGQHRGGLNDGFVPHIVFHRPSDTYFPGPAVWGVAHDPPTSGVTQPPVAASALRMLVERAHDGALVAARAPALFEAVAAWHAWWDRARDPERTGLVAALHPWETGMDNSPAWDAALARVPPTRNPYQRRDLSHVDAAMRPRQGDYDRYVHLVETYRACGWEPAAMWRAAPFKVADVGVNAILLRAERDLAALAARFAPAMVGAIEARATRRAAALESLWSEADAIYLSRDLVAGAPVEAATGAGFLPLWSGGLSPARAGALANTLARWRDLGAAGAPTVAPDDPAFEPKRYWRGPIWAVVNFMIGCGLAQHGEGALAEALRGDTRRLMLEGGFAEYFDPRDGMPLGGGAFSWTAAVGLAWALA